MKKRYGIPRESAVIIYPRHFTKGKKYIVIDREYETNIGLTLNAVNSIGEWNSKYLIEVYIENIVGGCLIEEDISSKTIQGEKVC